MKATVLLAIGFGLAACSAATDPSTPSINPVEATGAPKIENPEPAAATIIPNTPEPVMPTVTPVPAVSLPDLGPAPDFTNEVWLNSEGPLDLASLQGKVVLVEFWTFG